MMLAQVTSPEIVWWSILPLLTLAGGGVFLLTFASLYKKAPDWAWPAWTVAVAIGTIVTSMVSWAKLDNLPTDGTAPDESTDLWFETLGGMLTVDKMGVGSGIVLAAIVGLVALLGFDYLRREQLPSVEFYVLMMLSAAGGLTMAMANDLIVLFLGLEVLSIAIYVLAAYHLRRPTSQESGMKYFILGAFSSAFFLYGIALIYGATGTTKLAGIREAPIQVTDGDSGLLLAGIALLLVGFGFKVAAAPFHTWTPDVYDGAPSPAVAFMASAVKVAAFVAMYKVFVLALFPVADDWEPMLYALAVASLLIGSVLAVVQTNVKRMLAYSSISHAGFMLVALQAGGKLNTLVEPGPDAIEGVGPAIQSGSALLFYTVVYAFMVVGTFAIVTVVGGRGDGDHELGAYNGLASRRPVLALAFTVLLLSQAGVPFTSGFIAKLEVVSAASDAGSQWLAVIAMASAVIAGFLYLRIVLAMFAGDDAEASEDADDEEVEPASMLAIPPATGVVIAVAVGVTLLLGVFPGILDDLTQQAVRNILAL